MGGFYVNYFVNVLFDEDMINICLYEFNERLQGVCYVLSFVVFCEVCWYFDGLIDFVVVKV